MNYELDILIDESSLDIEWLNQPALAMQYGKYWADCFKQLQQAEEYIKIVKAELIKEVSEDPDKYLEGGAKPTGPVIEAYYRNHKRHRAAKDAWVIAQHNLNIAEIAKNEISFSRKAALENLVKLHGQNYFAGPSIPRDLSYETKQWQSQKRADAGVAKTFQRTKNNISNEK